jgi:hypothetical protein
MMARALGVFALLVAACGDDEGIPPDATPDGPPVPDATQPVDGPLPADADPIDAPTPADAGPTMIVHWSFLWNGSPATCADVGAVSVRVEDGLGLGTVLGTFPCGEGTGAIFGYWMTSANMVAIDDGGNPFVRAHIMWSLETSAVLEVIDEPEAQLQAIAAAAAAYYAANMSLPPDSGTTPFLGSCCANWPDMVCDPDPAVWSSPTWTALGFSITTRHRFVYSFAAPGSSFLARAHADLDCDGSYSTYEISGDVDATATVVIAPMTIEDPYE